MKEIFPIIVLYNERLENCNTYKTLIALHPDCKYMIYDNSPSPLYNREDLAPHVVYIHDKRNGGITVAYNQGAEYAHKHGFRWLLLLDQDTSFEGNYIQELERSMARFPQIKLFVPQLYYKENKPFSPSEYRFGIAKSHELESGIYHLQRLLPVNSGTCVATDSFMAVGGYDMNLRLDFADIDFFSRLSRKELQFCLIASKAYQDFSNNETDIRKLYDRYVIYLHDAKHLKRTGVKEHLSLFYSVARHTIALTLKSRRILFIRHFVCHYILSK